MNLKREKSKQKEKSKKHSVANSDGEESTASSSVTKVKEEPSDDEDEQPKSSKKLKVSGKKEEIKKPIKGDGKKSNKDDGKKVAGKKTKGIENEDKDGKNDKKPSGIDLGWTVIKCEGSKLDDDGQLFFKIKFKEGEKSQLIPAAVANRKCTEALTTYFTDRANYYERLNKDKRAGLGLKPKVFNKKIES